MRPEETPYEEAEALSRKHGPAAPGLDLPDEDYDFDDDPDLEDLNNPDVETLSAPPLLGRQPKSSDLFGVEAENFGRATSPKLYAAASQFPSATQFRVWRWENGVPVALGAIDAECNEEDFVRKFFDAMPKPGEGRFQFRLRPIDIRGEELGKEFTINVSEHHAVLKQQRRVNKLKEEEDGPWGGRYGRGPHGDIIVNPGGDNAGASYAEEMGRMFEQAVESAEERTRALQNTLEDERERLRDEEKRRAEERISMAERSADVVQKMTERLMESDRSRSEEAIKSQKEHSGFMLNTLTSVFSQQQEAARAQQDRMREMDQFRMQQDREFFERQRQEVELQRAREKDDAEQKRRGEREEWQRRREEERERMLADRERERRELEARRDQMKEERDRWQHELEERRRREQQEFERKMVLEREERERRERADRERWEREREMGERRREEERREWERRESLRREEMQREAERRREEMQVQMKQMEMNAQRDREHSERMMEMSRLEREAQREAQLQREKAEREAREAAERDRQRQHDMTLREMEMAKARDREHQERMMQLAAAQQSGTLGGLTEMLGMNTADVLGKIFGGEGEKDSGSWTEAIPKVLGSIAEIGKVALSQQPGKPAQHGRKLVDRSKDRMIPLQTPEGIQMVPASELAKLQAAGAVGGLPVPDLPAAPFVPSESSPVAALPLKEEEAKVEEKKLSPEESAYEKAKQINTIKRARSKGMSLPAQRKARKGVRDLAKRLEASPEEDWFGITAEAITTKIEIYHYIEAVSVYAALAEAKVGAELAGRIVKALQESGVIPDTVPYTEEDWQALEQEAQAMQEEDSETAEAVETILAEPTDQEEGEE